MAREPVDYWETRQTELMKRLERGTEKTIDALISSYEKATKDIAKEITKIFNKFSQDGKLTKEEAMKLLNTNETKQFYDDLLEQINSIKDTDIKRKLLAKYNAPAYGYRISRYEALQKRIDIEIKKIAEIEKQLTAEKYIDTINETYYRNIFDIQQNLGYVFSFSDMDSKTIDLLLNENWIDKANFSKRIWDNSEKLGNYLRTNLTAASMSGKSINKIVQELTNYMNVGIYNATRLVRTEVNHFANEAEMLAYEELDIEKYRFIATLDNRTCEHCAELDNKVFCVKDRKPGKNYPPLHPNDRCTTVAEFDDDTIDGLQRRARDENGNTILVQQNMNYSQWYDKYVDKEEGLLDNIFNKCNKDQLKDVSNQKMSIINNAFSNKNIKDIALETNIKSIKVGGNKSYHQKGNIVLKANYSNHTVMHELGHAVDYNNKWISSNRSFINSIELDKEYILNNQNLYKDLLKNNSNYRELSDIISGMTKNKIKGRYFHKNSYWNKPKKLEKEIFAQMFTAAGADDFKQLQIFQKYLPNTFRTFDNLIGGLL